MTDNQKREITRLRNTKCSYSNISSTLNIPINTVKSYCRRHGLGSNSGEEENSTDIDALKCLCCGTVIPQIKGRKPKRFCSDRCRNKWWNTHLNQVKRRANYDFVCKYCKKAFVAYGNKGRKYCSHDCYIADRFGGI